MAPSIRNLFGKRSAPEPRRGTPDPTLDETAFRHRFLGQFQDPGFEPLQNELSRVAGAAWDAYSHHRKSPRTRVAGAGFVDPDYELALDWIAAHEAVVAAQARHDDGAGPNRILLISGSSRSEHTCPGRCRNRIGSWRSRARRLPTHRIRRSGSSRSID